ncbi:ABC transporter substrate-binding protein [Egicoccus sp. AB-alg6-2]|uniref:ABC transporter substrate-binding protein n=1 Tax=Egicoccus sp. AB-alg6-2 TaxID=3242692 RepID=UPI00359EA2C0
MRVFRSKVLAVATLFFVAAACTGTTPESATTEEDAASSSEDVTLKWLIEEPEDAAALQALEDHIAEFEAASGITIDIDTLPWENMRTILQTQLRSGDGPDVFNWGAGPSWGGALAEAGMLLDLTDAYEERGWDVYDFAVERVTAGDQIYGIPGEMEIIGIFYNQEIFDELGIEEPQNLEELRAAAETVREAGILPMAVSDKAGWEGGHLLSMSLSSNIGSDAMEALFEGEQSWDSPEVVESLQLWKDFHDADFLPPSPTSVDYDTAISTFYAGDAAMLPTGSWLVNEIDTNADFEVGYFAFPAPDGNGIFAGGLGSGPFVNAQTEHPEAALEFLDFLASPEHAKWTIENLGSIPPIPTTGEDLDVSPLMQQVVDDVSGFADGGDFGYNIDVMVGDAFNEAMYDGIQGLFTGQTTAEEIAANLAAASDS